MDFTIEWTEPATADLEEIVRYSTKRNPSAAERLGAEILQHVEILARFPFIGPVYERDSSGRTRAILCRKYRTFYRVVKDPGRVEILTVWHGFRQDPIGRTNGLCEDLFMAEMTIRFIPDPVSGKKNIIITLRSDEDALPHEHEQQHKALVEKLINQGTIKEGEVGQIVVTREEEDKEPAAPVSTEQPQRQAQAHGN